MPRPLIERHELQHLTVPADQQVCRHFESADFVEVRMRIEVELVRKQRLDLRPTKLSGRQADAVQYNQVHFHA